LAVYPDYRRRGIGQALLAAAIAQAKQMELYRLEAWTRDDAPTLRWYEAQGFQKVETYLHVYLQRDEMLAGIRSILPGLRPMHGFASELGINLNRDKLRQ
jgi:ribosomal protein S18 acetylase RimI-like enzyme